MKLHFDLYARRPLGRHLGDILQRVEKYPPTTPQALSLSSRYGREDLPREELLAWARTCPADVCHIRTTTGEITAVWKYGPGSSIPTLFGSTQVSSEGLSVLDSLLVDLAMLVGSSYAICDLETAGFSPADGTDPYVAKGLFFDVFWWNYFGPEYKEALPLNDEIRTAATRARVLSNGAIVLITRGDPREKVNDERVRKIAACWPLFLRWNPRAISKVAIDYSEIRGLAPPAPVVEKRIVDFVGSADEFIGSVSVNSQRFLEWAATKGIRPVTEDDFRKLFRQFEPVIRDELLVPAIAAYGEALRSRLSGEWSKSWLFGRGEPVVGRPGKPWSRRRVVAEVLEALHGTDE